MTGPDLRDDILRERMEHIADSLTLLIAETEHGVSPLNQCVLAAFVATLSAAQLVLLHVGVRPE